MQALQSFAPAVLAELIRRQPPSPERTAFAWSVAVGPALARVTSVEMRNQNLIVSARDVQWARELERSRETILLRVQHLLGRDYVKGMYINA
jgi:predicted nucleic acid-binding Zn ribbon protein